MADLVAPLTPGSVDAVRQVVYGTLAAQWPSLHPTVPIDYENRGSVDPDSAVGPFVSVDIVFTDSRQVDLNQTPKVRYLGALWFGVMVKCGEGLAEGALLQASLTTMFALKSVATIQMRAATPLPGKEVKGWYLLPLRIPFKFDALS